MAKESELVSLPTSPILIDELKGEPDSLFVRHQDQGIVVITLGDEGAGCGKSCKLLRVGKVHM